MGWAQTTRVLLVWPAQGRVLARRIDLLLLQRHARQLGAQLALITTDPLVREYARELGLPTFGSVEASRGHTWRARAPRDALALPPRERLDRSTLRPPPPFRPPAGRPGRPWPPKGV